MSDIGIRVGEIVLINPGRKDPVADSNEQLIIVIHNTNNDSYLGLEITSAENDSISSEWKLLLEEKSLHSGQISYPLWIDVQKPLHFKKETYLKIFGKVSIDLLDELLRLNARFCSKIYYDSQSQKKSGDYIPVSGKVLDEKDLFNMIDASLDMWLTTGRFNDKFQIQLQKFLGVRYALTVNSGSSANLLAITALTSPALGKDRLMENDEVITVAVGFPTTVNPIIQNRLVPVFIDVEVGTYNINVEQIEEAITPKTKAIIVAHTLGNPFNISRIMEIVKKYKLWLIEDNCDALGAKYNGKYTGSFGHLATMSFYPAHHITMGEGGAVIVNDNRLYKIVMSYRDWGRDCWCDPGKDNTCGKRFDWQLGNLPHGYDHKYIYSHVGYNLKITDWQAAIGLSQLNKLPGFIQKRKDNFTRMYKGLEELQDFLILPKATENSEPSWFGFLITVKESAKFSKNEMIDYLESNKIGTRQLFAGNILRQPAYLNTNFKFRIRNSPLLDSASFTKDHYHLLQNSDTIMMNTFWVGVTPLIDFEKIDVMITVIKNFFKSRL